MRKFTLIIALFTSIFAFGQQAKYCASKKLPYEPVKIDQPKTQEAIQQERAAKGIFFYEDFNSGNIPSGWTLVDNTGQNFPWIITDQPPGGQYSTTIPVIASTSGGYFMSLRGDYYNTPFPGGTPVNMDAYFQTGAIDCSGKAGVVLSFQEYFRYCCSASAVHISVFVSTDATNWTEFDVRNSVGVNTASANPLNIELNISSIAANQPTVYLRWYMYGGSHYFWMVDDIQLASPPVNDVKMTNYWPTFSGAGYQSYTPLSQIQQVWFSANVLNFGTADQTNIGLNVKVNDYATTLYDWNTSVDSIIAVLPSQGIDSVANDSAFFMTDEIKTYQIQFKTYADQIDEFPANNYDTISFTVSDTVMARDWLRSTTAGPCRYVGTNDGDFCGTTFYLFNPDEVSSISIYITSNSTAGTTLIGKIYRWDSGSSSWLEVISTDIHDVTDGELGTWVTVPIIPDGTSEFLTEGAWYNVGIECYWTSTSGKLYVGGDDIGPHDYANSSSIRMSDTWYFDDVVPMIRMNVKTSGVPLSAYVSHLWEPLCNGGNDGEVTVTAAGGTAPYTYLWSNSQATATISGLTAGTYTCTVTDATSATVVATAIVGEPTAINIASTLTEPTCNGDNNGLIDITITGGTPSYIVDWSNGNLSQDVENVAAGTYNITVTDYNGCLANASFVLTEPEAITISGVSTMTTTAGGNDGAINITVANGTAPYTYAWSNSAVTEDLTGLTAGTYTVTVTDANGCTASKSFVILDPPTCTLTVTPSVTNVSCNGGSNGSVSVSVTGGSESFTYAWDNGPVTSTVTSLPAGSYTVTITDSNDATCWIMESLTITEPTEVSISVAKTDVNCNGGNDGAIDITVTGGTTPYTFAWSNSTNTEDLTGLTAGAYTGTVTDANGCTITGSVTITEPTAILVTETHVNASNNDGSIDLTVSGGVTPYTFAWSNSAITEDITGLAAGDYTYTVTDANACTASATITIADISNCQLTVSVAGTDVLCNGGATGTVTATPANGTSPYSYTWSVTGTTATLNNLAAGTYSVTVTDANACTATGSVTITQPAALTAAATAEDMNISATIAGGTTPYTYSWTGPNLYTSTSKDNTVTSTGFYNLTVTDANSCTATSSVNVLSINDVAGKAINIYPNPTKGLLNIANADNASITVYNIIGETVTSISKASNLTTIDLSNVAEGSYLIRIVSEKQTITKRIYIVK